MSKSSGCGGCFTYIVLLVVSFFFGGFCFDYSLYSYFGKDIPWYVDCLVGWFTSPINVPLAVIALVLRSCGVEPPIFG